MGWSVFCGKYMLFNLEGETLKLKWMTDDLDVAKEKALENGWFILQQVEQF